MKDLSVKLVSLLATCCISANIASAIPVTATSSVDSIIANLTANELELCEKISSDFGFENVRAMFEETVRSFDPDDYSGSIRDINGDHSITITDASYVLNFVNGNYLYNYSFESLDVDGNLVINSTDAYIYLQFAVYMQIHPELTNYFPSGTGSAPSNAYEERIYVKHMRSSGDSPSTDDVVYKINSDGSTTTQTNPWNNPDYSPALSSNDEQETYQPIRTSPYTRIQDTRVVRCAGTGFIIGEHTILTNAHCIFSLSSGKYNITPDVCAFTFNSNNDPIRRNLTVLSYYMPMAYYDPSCYSTIGANVTNSWKRAYNDYAIIVVEEDLTNYGKYECGIPLNGLASGNITSNLSVCGFPKDEYGSCYVEDDGVFYRKYTVKSDGSIVNFTNGYWISTTAETAQGMSGAPIVLNSISVNNEIKSGNESVIGINREGLTASGDLIVRPILQFCYNNAVLEAQLDLL